MTLLFATLLLAAPSAGAPPAVQSAVTTDTAPARANQIGVNVGLGSPVGSIGLTYDRALGRWLQLQLGVGRGWSGVQLSVLPRLIFWRSGVASFFVGAGPALALQDPDDGDEVLWANAEVGVQAQGERFYLQFGAGATTVLTGEVRGICLLCDLGADTPSYRPGKTFPMLRWTVGVRF